MIETSRTTISTKRFTELIAKEERLKVLETALMSMSGYQNIDTIKNIFGLNMPTTQPTGLHHCREGVERK